ncbi:UV DNA damage repair endonuclease UvsE [Geosporobacter ferrireducens]|uniref:UV damage endonuclease UvsE n=1 Tax=Geosporobacter ferrireducens TaxID=1424294 RepID=A0A1D8GBD2_9FIRM|nr:UV DNA damage repair endonuclease UvsE [Geosporobacter ferrireducens]AOT68198.1 UV damage endonuclease UvsE [Geosporobacter ferrireducens]MTI54248.1 UV DNA damage repair endonuclease UvsE [Geosporobacter ferrireducens]
MIIRLGYVAISLSLHEASPNKTITYKSYEKLKDDESKLYRLKDLVKENLANTKRILIHNQVHDIKVYRFTSKLIPLATHPDVIQWDYTKAFEQELLDIGSYSKQHQLRVSAHPDHFTLLNSPKENILASSLRDLKYHVNLFEGMNLSEKEAKLVLHVGGIYDSKSKAIERFKTNFVKLPPSIRNRIVLENDDKVYTARDALSICKDLGIPMVLDIHHHWCNNNGENLSQLLGDIFKTWDNEIYPPKIHVSSPKPGKNIRAHADDVDVNFFYHFLQQAKTCNRNFDAMLEAKNKDIALFNLVEQLKAYSNIEMVDGASFIYH